MTDEQCLIESLKAGDERAFARLLDEYSSALFRVAMAHVGTRAVAEEVVQETWLGVINGIDRFEGRSSLKTWIFRILTNTANTRGQRERRVVPFSALGPAADDGPAVDADRFFPPDHARYPDHWALGPTAWETPEEGLLSAETRELILRAIDELPEAQRTVVTLRDVQGWSPEEVCDALQLSDGNQRVLLHRARTKIRASLESYFDAVEETVAVTPAA
jgi:RNA polymerase sigma-70 factor (ECF subfamily)